MIASRYSVYQSSSVAGLHARIDLLHGRIAAHFAAGVRAVRDDRARGACRRRPRSTSSVSAAPQTPVRRSLAFTTIARAMRDVRIPIHIHVAVALEMPDDRHARFLLHARDEALAAARHDDVDVSVIPASM